MLVTLKDTISVSQGAQAVFRLSHRGPHWLIQGVTDVRIETFSMCQQTWKVDYEGQ